MFRTLVVPLDGSELAERALPYAVRLADAGGGELVLVRVALAPAPARIDGADWDLQQTEAVEEAEVYLARVAEKLATQVTVETSVPYGRAAEQIVEAVERLGADGVVMATHGRTGLAHLLYGSVAESVLSSSPVPVFLVHALAGEAPSAPAIARAAVPLDGSAFAEAALKTAAELVGPTGELVLVSVVAPPDHVERDENGRVVAYLDQQEEARTREAREYLAEVAKVLAENYPTLRVSIHVRIGEPAMGIVIAAGDRGSDVGRDGHPRADGRPPRRLGERGRCRPADGQHSGVAGRPA